MDTVSYSEILRDLIMKYARYEPSYGDVETEVIIDPEKGHYELLHVGWHGDRRIHGSVIHIDIKGDKIWIQHDGTAPGVALDLVEAGVSREAIVLGFRPPHVRSRTGFAAA